MDGSWVIPMPSWSTEIKAAGTTVRYTHKAAQYADRIYIEGPTTEKLKLMVCRQLKTNHCKDS